MTDNLQIDKRLTDNLHLHPPPPPPPPQPDPQRTTRFGFFVSVSVCLSGLFVFAIHVSDWRNL